MARFNNLSTFYSLTSRFLRPYWRAFLTAIVLFTLAGFAKGIQPLVFAPVIETFTGSAAAPAESFSEINLNNLAPTMSSWLGMDITHKWQMILFGISCYIGIALVWSTLTTGAFLLSLRTRSLVSRDTMAFLHRHILGLPLAYFHRRRAGDFVSRLTNDAILTANSLDTVVRGIIQSTAEICIYGFMLFRTDVLLSFAIMALGSVHLGITRVLSTRLRRSTRRTFARKGFLGHQFLESIQGMRIIKSFSSERFESRRVVDAIEEYRRENVRNKTIHFAETPARHMADALLVCSALGLSFMAYNQGRLGTGGFILYVALCMRAIVPIAGLSRQILLLNKSVGGATRVTEILAYVSPLTDGPGKADELRESIELHDVDFSYDAGGRKVLDKVNLTIGKNETVALVGPSGSGKTTLADLVLRLYDPTGGNVTYDGTDIREFRQRPYRKNFGVVGQDPVLFHMSLKDNIVYSRDFDESQLKHAVTIANAEEFISHFPNGIETVVGDRGVMMSGGQRQRIAIARAVYGSPSILILDEATSSLDSKSELEVQGAIAEAVKGVTALIIAHRLSTILKADKIVVLNEGRVEAVGQHPSLLEESPTYRELYNLQFGATQFQSGA
jgi:subfamily B ATP-binding cassette protein MsbA